MIYKNFYTATTVEPGDEFLVIFKVWLQHNAWQAAARWQSRGYKTQVIRHGRGWAVIARKDK